MADELQVFRGKDYSINSDISIHQPTLDEITDYGEQSYFGLVKTLCATPADKKVEIWKVLHIYWDQMDEFELFVSLFRSVKDNDMSILFRDMDFASFQPMFNPKINEVILRNKDGVIIDRAIHALMTDHIRKIHRIKKNVDVGFDDYTKDVMIEDDMDEQERLAKKPFSSFLVPMISSLTNSEGFKYCFHDVWTLPIGAFMDSVERIQKLKAYNYMMHGIYSGCVDIKKINKKDLNWMGELK